MPHTAQASTPAHPWYGIQDVDLDTYLDDLRKLIRNVLLPPELRETNICYGFKEVRYPYMSKIADLDKFLQFIRLVMPATAFVFNFRDHEEVLKSGVWSKGNEAKGQALLSGFEPRARLYAGAHLDHSFTIEYAEIAGGGARLREMFDFLGADYDITAINKVLAVDHSTITSRP
jgi:hypothetical protein